MHRLLSFSLILLLITSCNDPASLNPVISSLSKPLGQIGQQISITGSRFSSDASEDIVTFNGTQAQVVSAAPDALDVIVPVGATTGKIVVSVNGRSTTGPVFTIYVPGTLTSISPVCGPRGTAFTIEGSGFETNKFNMQLDYNYSYLVQTSPTVYTPKNGTSSIDITSLSSTQIQGVIPTTVQPDADGNVVVKAFETEQLFVNGINGANVEFAVMPFTITSFAPKSGPAGSQIVISGVNFGTDASLYTVIFQNGPSGIIPGTITNITDTQITVVVPVTAITGGVYVFLQNHRNGAAPLGVFTVAP